MLTKKIIYTIIAAFVTMSPVLAQKKQKKADKKTVVDTTAKKPVVNTDIKSYSDLITDKAVTKAGFLTIHQVADKYYFEIPDSILKREILLSNWIIKVPGGSPKYGGELSKQYEVFSFDKGTDKKIFLRNVYRGVRADSTQTIAKAVRDANINSIAMVFDVKAYGKNNNSSVIDVTDLFQKENMFSGVDGMLKGALGLGGVAADRSYVKKVQAFPLNIELTSVKTFTAMAKPATAAGAAGPATAPIQAAVDGGAVTLELRTSLMLMPKVPMQPRLFDERVGYFADGYSVMSDTQQRVEDKVFITKYRLEPKEEDIEKYKRGELVEPKKQIVYYTDPATPKQWRKYIIQGINDWQKAFEQAGFKNAIVGKEWPENDTTMSTEDARYAIIRYLPSPVANAYGPNIHDPRSGEILQSYVGWYHNIMQLLQGWYFTQAAAVDPGARKMKFDEDLMGQLIQFAVSHELGHTLGLRHNMGSSSFTPVEKLRDRAWVEANGHTVSLMDYARFNYVAQPEDHISREGIMPRIGIYDKWAIEWGYKYTGIKNPIEEKKLTSKWIVERLKADPRLWFGGEGRNNDPRCQTEDLGDNSMKASEYGIKNLKVIMANILEWTKEDNDQYTNLKFAFSQVWGQYGRYLTHVANNIGGVYETLKTREQEGDVFAPALKARQKEAVEFLNREVFQTPYWLIPSAVMNKFSGSTKVAGPEGLQTQTLKMVLSDKNFASIMLCAERYGAKNTYSLPEFLTDIKKGVWTELNTNKTVDIYRRKLQKQYILQMFEVIKEAEIGGKSLAGALFGMEEMFPDTRYTDISTVIYAQLEKIRTESLATMTKSTDKMTKAHYKYVADIIRKGLANAFNKEKKTVLGD